MSPPDGAGQPERDLSALNVAEMLRGAAEEAPDELVLVSGDERVSYRELDRRVDVAASIWQSLGVEKGDRVAFMLENCPQFLVAWLGLARAGGVLVAINTRWQEEEIRYLLNLSEPRLALVGSRLAPVFRRAAQTCAKTLRIVRPEDLEAPSGGAPSPPPIPVRISSDDPISFICTSGTTGRPKAVVQTHGNYVLTGEGYRHWVELQHGERIYLCLPLFHINSQAYTTMGAIAARATVVMAERFSASRFWGDMNRYGVNVFNFVGSMLAILLQREPTPEERSHEVRLAYGGPVPAVPSREEIERRFHLTVISGIGMSETTYGLIESVHGERREGSLGKPRQHPDPRIVNEARVVDDDDRELPPGEIGELVFRNPVMMKGYYRNPGATSEAVRAGWLHTGDLVRQDPDGYFYFVDRKKDIIRVRGENVASAEVERVLMDHPDVQEAGVVAVPSELTDDDIAAFVVLCAGRQTQSSDLAKWCRDRLADFKVPRHLWIVDALPKTETQRIEKHRLRLQAREMLDGSSAGSTR